MARREAGRQARGSPGTAPLRPGPRTSPPSPSRSPAPASTAALGRPRRRDGTRRRPLRLTRARPAAAARAVIIRVPPALSGGGAAALEEPRAGRGGRAAAAAGCGPRASVVVGVSAAVGVALLRARAAVLERAARPGALR